MSERLRFIARVEDGERVADLAHEFGISEKTAYKFLNRWRVEGVRGLEDRSHAVERIPHRTPQEVIDLILKTRRENPSWGGRMLKARIEKQHPGLKIPSPTVIAYWLKKNGLVRPPPQRRRNYPRPATALTSASAPNDVWATDFKGEFRLGNRAYCYPLTATDLATRYILTCDALEGTKGGPVWGIFERLFTERGLPKIIRTDNGTPFASPRGLAGLTWVSARWIRLGIKHERIEPSHPEQNGQHERMHRTLKQATTRPAGKNLLQQQERFDNFVEDFNQERPHQALGMRPPADFYRNSERPYCGLPELDYPFADDVCLVRSPGCVFFTKRTKFYLTEALVGERVGIREIDDGKWLVTWTTMNLGVFDEYTKKFDPLNPAAGISNGVGDASAIPVDSSADGPVHRAAPPPDTAAADWCAGEQNREDDAG